MCLSFFVSTAELRKLLKLRLAAKEYKFKRDMIMDYAKPSSQVFAPLTRLGVFPDRSSERYVVKNIYSSRYEGNSMVHLRI